MSRRLLVLNVALGIVSVVLAVGIFRTLLLKRPVPSLSAPRVVSAPASAAPAAAIDAGPAAYTVIAARNLFNSNRNETAAAAAAPVVKPILHGVVIVGARSRAFLEDPMSKRVGGYSVGDTVGGGRLQKIADDRVVIARPEGLLEVLLQDPSKPRPTPTPPAAPAVPGQVVPAQVGPVPPGPPQVGAPPNQAPPSPPQVRRRILQERPGND
jgi:hypothetical protein